MKKKSYHKFVFDEKKRKYIGNFEDMYKFEKIGIDYGNNLITKLKLNFVSVEK